MKPELSREYLDYYLQENWGINAYQWLGNFPKPGEVLNILQIVMTTRPDVNEFIAAVKETMDTRFTCKRKLEALVK